MLHVQGTLSSKIMNELICNVLYKCRAIETSYRKREWTKSKVDIYIEYL